MKLSEPGSHSYLSTIVNYSQFWNEKWLGDMWSSDVLPNCYLLASQYSKKKNNCYFRLIQKGYNWNRIELTNSYSKWEGK